MANVIITTVKAPTIGETCTGCIAALDYIRRKWMLVPVEGSTYRLIADDVETVNKRFHMVHQHKLVAFVSAVSEGSVQIYRREDFVAMLEKEHGVGYALLKELESRQEGDCLYIEGED